MYEECVSTRSRIITMAPLAGCNCPNFGLPKCNTESVLKCTTATLGKILLLIGSTQFPTIFLFFNTLDY